MKTLKTSSSKKDILSIADLSTNEISKILILADKLKREQKERQISAFFARKNAWYALPKAVDSH